MIARNFFTIYNAVNPTPIWDLITPSTQEDTQSISYGDLGSTSKTEKKEEKKEESKQENNNGAIPAQYVPIPTPPRVTQSKYRNTPDYETFNRAYDAVEQRNPEAKKFRPILTALASKESNFKHNIQNLSGAPAYGYFQFMQDGKRWNNISHYAGTDIETFRNNPELQIEAAVKLANDFIKGFSEDDLNKAEKQGYNIYALLAGAWAGGVGGVRKVLNRTGDPSDKHWSKSGAGTSVKQRMDEFNQNFKNGGIVKAQKGTKSYKRIVNKNWDSNKNWTYAFLDDNRTPLNQVLSSIPHKRLTLHTLINEGYTTNLLNTKETVKPDSAVVARNPEYSTNNYRKKGNFGLDNLTQNREGQDKPVWQRVGIDKSRLSWSTPSDGRRNYGADKLTLNEAVQAINAIANDGKKLLYKKYGADKVSKFLRENPGAEDQLLYSYYQAHGNFNNRLKKHNTIQEFYNSYIKGGLYSSFKKVNNSMDVVNAYFKNLY